LHSAATALFHRGRRSLGAPAFLVHSMLEIAQAANIVEAQLLADELRSGGLDVFVSGGYLSGAIGELPADTVLRLYINDASHESRARDIVAAFEAARNERVPKRWCGQCEQWIDGQFGCCWQCGSPMPVQE